jgi:DNA-binding CsgD family transcriptional regulator
VSLTYSIAQVLRGRSLDEDERELIRLVAQATPTAELASKLGLSPKSIGYRLDRVAVKLNSPNRVRSGLVYRALVLRQVEAEPVQAAPPIRLRRRERAVLRGVAQGRPLTRIADDLRMEDWDLSPVALRLRERLGADDYAHAVWRGWHLRLIDAETPGIGVTITRSSPQTTAAGSRELPRPPRTTGAPAGAPSVAPGPGVSPRPRDGGDVTTTAEPPVLSARPGLPPRAASSPP